MCIKGGVKFIEEEEERCPKALHLTLDGVIKTLVESEGGERRKKTKKIKRVKPEMPKDQAPTAAPGEDDNNKRGGHEAHLEQPVLSPIIDQRIST